MALPDKVTKPKKRRGSTYDITRHRRLAELCYEHPDWTAVQLLEEAGFSPKTARHKAKEILNNPAVLKFKEEFKGRFERRLIEKGGGVHPVEIAADSVLDAAKGTLGPKAVAYGCDTILEHFGVKEPKDRLTIINAVRVEMGRDVMDILTGILTNEQGVEFATRLAQRGDRQCIAGALPVEAAKH